jgi:hypothetical protein
LIEGIKKLAKPGLSLLWLMAVLIAPATFAGDEDMSPNAYHIFDPETGYMITVESVPDGQQASNEGNSTLATGSTADQSTTSEKPGVWSYLIIAIALAAGFTAWLRYRIRDVA